METSRQNKLITYRPYTHENFERIPQLGKLSLQHQSELIVISRILPFKTNNYIINELINWDDTMNDPMFRLTFPQKEMLHEDDYATMARALECGTPVSALEILARQIREKMMLWQKDSSFRSWYQATAQKLVFYPTAAQTCHAYCTFCFRWPQFAGVVQLRTLQNELQWLAQYVCEQEELQEIEFTGGDPLFMSCSVLTQYLDPLIGPARGNLNTITLATKSLSYWPYRFTLDEDATDLILLFEKIVNAGIKLVIKAHFTHPVELSTRAVAQAIQRIRNTGAEIRTQSPVVRQINDSAVLWADLWKKQTGMGCIPQYMLISQPVGLQHHFTVPIVKVLQIYKEADKINRNPFIASGGPVVQCAAGKIRIQEIDQNLLSLELIEARKKEWEENPFIAIRDEKASWISDLLAPGNRSFFFEEELEDIYGESIRIHHQRGLE